MKCDILDRGERLDTVKKWLETCEQKHSLCKEVEKSLSSSYPTRLPTRLIDISQPVPRLVYPRDDSNIAYSALSHCWGDHLPLTTTTVNISMHELAIPQNELPKTYREAFDISRDLGVYHIWIDSLCIIQDDAADWEREAARMSSVYENAHFTIAALWGSSGLSGCFNDNSASFSVAFEDRSRWPRLTKSRLYLRPCSDPIKDLRRAALSSRAW